MRRTPPVGFPVQFFAGGSKKGTDPIAAMVTRAGINGAVKLSLFYSNGGDIKTSSEFVHHIDDPWVQEHADHVRGVRYGVQRGVWDWVPGIVYEPSDEELEQSPEMASRRKDGEDRVILLLRQDKPLHEIAKQVRTFGLSKADVEVIAEREMAKV